MLQSPMPANHLEQLAWEYYTYRGYWVYANVRLSQHGFPHPHPWKARELDIIALSPSKQDLVHMELAGGFESTETLNAQYAKKREAGLAVCPNLFAGMQLPPVRHRIVWVTASATTTCAGWEVTTLRDFLREVDSSLPPDDFLRTSAPEKFPILRTLHLSRWLRY